MAKFLIILLFGFVAGCAFNNHDTISEMSREVVLSRGHPQDDILGARLVDVAPDGTTTIQVVSSGSKLTAAPGGYFVSDEYGRIGLQLVSSSAEKHEARFIRRSAK
jgi:hypothetical protein